MPRFYCTCNIYTERNWRTLRLVSPNELQNVGHRTNRRKMAKHSSNVAQLNYKRVQNTDGPRVCVKSYTLYTIAKNELGNLRLSRSKVFMPTDHVAMVLHIKFPKHTRWYFLCVNSYFLKMWTLNYRKNECKKMNPPGKFKITINLYRKLIIEK